MPVLALLFLFFGLAASTSPVFAEAESKPEATLLYVTPGGELRMANVSARETRLPVFSLAPGRNVRRMAVSPDGARVLLETAAASGLCSVWSLHLGTGRSDLLGTGLVLPGGRISPFSPDSRRVALRQQQGDRMVVFLVSTAKRVCAIAVPGSQEAPAWFGDGWRLAVPVETPADGSRIAIYDATRGTLVASTPAETVGVRYRFGRAEPGHLVYRETREGVDRWLAVLPSGETLETDEPLESALPADLPAGAVAELSPDGKWVAYTLNGALYLRYSDLGSESVELAPAKAFLWKPGAPLPERAPVPPPLPPAQSTRPTAPAVVPGVITLQVLSSEAVEGEPLEIAWEPGPHVATVRLSASVVRVPKGVVRRGAYAIPIARVPAAQRRFAWVVPWVDNITFVLRAEALSASARVLGRAERVVSFRPRELANERQDGIYVHLSRPGRQRLYVQEGGRLTMVFLCSGSSTRHLLPANQHPDAPHDHFGTFRITAKDPDHVSNLDSQWKMPYAMRYLAGHWIHVTARNQYYRLGRPGSHGCIRLHREDGIRLYNRTPVGTRVVIY